MGSLFQDARYAFRTLSKTPGITAAIVVSVALGIAANATVFSVANGLLWGVLPVKDPARLVLFSQGKSFSHPDYLDLRGQTSQVFDGVAAHFPFIPASIGATGQPERVWGQAVSGNYFHLLGVNPALGRTILPADDGAVGREPVVVLSHALWQRRFGADPAVLGRVLALNGHPYTVVGVAPAGFYGSDHGIQSEFWAPLSMAEQLMPDLAMNSMRDKRDMHWLMLNARLKPGVSRSQAAAAVNVVKRRLDDSYRKDEKAHYEPVTLDAAGGLIGGAGPQALGLMAVLMVVAGLVLLVACANIANLLLARATGRQKEIAVRLAIGASRRHLVRQLLVESVLLSLAGAVAGFLLAAVAAAAISRFRLPLPIPIVFDFNVDWRVLLFTAALSVLTGLVFGLAPALRSTHPDLVEALKNETPALGRLRRFSLRNALVVVQVALSLVLLVGAGLFLRSLGNASSIDIGMKPDNVLLMAVDPKLEQYSPEKTRAFLEQIRDRVSALAGVRSVSFVDSLPLSIGGVSFDFKVADGNGRTPQNLLADTYRVGSGYWGTMGIPLRQGRDFSRKAGDDRVAIINETLARRAFGNQNPLGRRIESDEPGEKTVYTVIGVARDSKSRTLGEQPQNCAYLFIEAHPEKAFSFFGISIAVRTAADPGALAKPVRDQIAALDPNLAVLNTETMRQHVNKSFLLPQISATLLGTSGAVGLTLAAIGLYGVMSFSVRRRTREIGIRMALGAEPHGVLAMVLRQGLALTGAGLAIGLAVALAVGRLAASLLYGISGTDLITFLAVPAVLVAAALVAILIPARRAARLGPMTALRTE